MDHSSFVLETGSKLCLFILFSQPIPWGLRRTARSPLIWRKVPQGRRVTRLPLLPWSSQHFLHFLTETWRLITLETNSGQEPFFHGKVIFLAKPGQLGQGERIRPCASLFSALGSGEGVNSFSYEHLWSSWLRLGGWPRGNFSLCERGLIRMFSWYRFNKQNNNSSRASDVFINLFAVTTLYGGLKHPKTNSFFSIYTLMSVLPKNSVPRKNHLNLTNIAN